MFSYQPMSELEIEENKKYILMKEGLYNFQVNKAEFEISKTSGSPMIKLSLTVWDNDGKEFSIFDYLVGMKTMEWKTRHFCESVGLIKEYENNSFNENLCDNKSGKVKIKIQKGKPKGDGTYYSDNNSVEDYIVTLKNSESFICSKEDEKTFIDDGLPF